MKGKTILKTAREIIENYQKLPTSMREQDMEKICIIELLYNIATTLEEMKNATK